MTKRDKDDGDVDKAHELWGFYRTILRATDELSDYCDHHFGK